MVMQGDEMKYDGCQKLRVPRSPLPAPLRVDIPETIMHDMLNTMILTRCRTFRCTLVPKMEHLCAWPEPVDGLQRL